MKKTSLLSNMAGDESHALLSNMSEDNKIGLAFSGGGIRSAALSSGVLRRLLHRGVQADYVSCVSGGNFVAAAFLDWKYRHDQKDDHKWHKEFFEYMRSRVGYICSWEKPLQGIVETVILTLLVITINFFIPCVMYSVMAMPAAYVIDYVFGPILRKGFKCVDMPVNSTGTGNAADVDINATERHCTAEFSISHPDIRELWMLFVLLPIAFSVCYVFKVAGHRSIRYKARFLQTVCAMLFALTFLPWLIQQFIQVTPPWLNTLFFLLSVFFWLGFPPLRRKASLALGFYFYAFVVKWRVYKTAVVGVSYDEHTFYLLLLISGLFIWASPYLGMFGMTSVFTYFKWRIQRAFFTKTSVGELGCRGISCRDFFPIISCFRPKHDPTKNPLVMADLQDVTPQYISNVAVDYWRKKTSRKEPSYGVMALSPTENERIDHQPGDPGLEDKLSPLTIQQPDAMLTSAAVMALSREQDEPFRDLQILLGLTIRKSIRSHINDEFGCQACGILSKIIPVIVQSIAAFPVIFLAIIALGYVDWNIKNSEVCAIAVMVAYFLLFFGIAIMPTGKNQPRRLERFARWCQVHLYHVRLLREMFQVENVGSCPPALLSLSDAGRLEKYGLLPLLKKRVKKILVVDGSFLKNDEDYSKYLLKSMEQARKELYCEFVGFGGRDALEEMRKKYVDIPPGYQPRSYRFMVKYFDKKTTGNPAGEYVEAGTGEIMILAPRHPDKGVKCASDHNSTWAQYNQDTGEELDTKLWGPGPVLSSDEVDRLTFCCCESCHTSSGIFRWISGKLCLGFPSTSTANQFFTPSLFTAYHREGYRACVESEAEEFLTGSRVNHGVNVV